VLWYEHVNSQVRTLVVADGLVLAGTDTGRIYALSAASGAHQWALDTGGSLVTSLAAAYGIAYVGSDGGDLTAFDAASGNQVWSLQNGRGWSGSAVANGVVYLTSDDGDLHALDAWTGTEIGAVGANALSSPAVAGGAVYVGTSSGLAAIAP
jgi:outer membrane protein assembly factor BamB